MQSVTILKDLKLTTKMWCTNEVNHHYIMHTQVPLTRTNMGHSYILPQISPSSLSNVHLSFLGLITGQGVLESINWLARHIVWSWQNQTSASTGQPATMMSQLLLASNINCTHLAEHKVWLCLVSWCCRHE